jgi:penicillin amidase
MRIEEVLKSGDKFTLEDMKKLQQDYLSIPARNLVPYLKDLHSSDPRTEKAIQMLLSWDFVLDENSVEATLYMAWLRRLIDNVWELLKHALNGYRPARRPMKIMMNSLAHPDEKFGEDPAAGRDAVLIKCLEQAISDLEQRLGSDMSLWKYGQEKFHHIMLDHALSKALSDELRTKVDIGPLPRGGSGFTVNMTGSGHNQRSGASFRIIADCSDWDNSVGTNCPGQSGNPENPHYKDLFEPWASGQYFPVYFSRHKVESASESILMLIPKRKDQP